MGTPSPIDTAETDDVDRRPRSEITQLRRLRQRGDELSQEQEGQLRAYYGRYSRQKPSIHLREARAEEWRTLAARQGVSLSSWIQERVAQALDGPGEVVREVSDENRRLRDEVAALRGTSGHLAVENSKLHARIEAMEGNLMEAMEQALRLAEAAP